MYSPTPSGPEEAHSVSLSKQSCTVRWHEAFCRVKILTHIHWNTVYEITKYTFTLNLKSNQSCTNPACGTPTTHKYMYTSDAPLHQHKTVAIAQINISDWPCMSLAVTGTLWYERDPIDPRPTSPSSSKGHHSITIDPLCVSDCVCVCEGERWRGVWANEAQPAED